MSTAAAALRERNASSRAESARLIATSRDKGEHPGADPRAGQGPSPDVEHLANRLLDARDPGAVLEVALRAVRSLVPGRAAAGALLRTGRTIEMGPTLGNEAEVSLRAELRGGAGPGTAALAASTEITVPDVTDARAEVRWPAYCREAAAAGVRSVAALPLRGHGRRPAAVLLLVSAAPAALDPRVVEAARTCAAVTSLGLLRVLGGASATRALSTRDAIGQAKGLLMREHGVDPDEAFDRLVRISQARNVKLVDVAREVVQAHLRSGAARRRCRP